MIARAVVIWLGVRITAAFVSFLFGGQPLVDRSLLTSVVVVALVTWLTFFEARRRHEAFLLANLGVSRSRLVVLAAAPALALEVAIRWLPAA